MRLHRGATGHERQGPGDDGRIRLRRGRSHLVEEALDVREEEQEVGLDEGRVNVKALLLTLGVTYQLARFASVFGGYTFFQQRSGGTSSSDLVDVDQSRVRFGLQFGYPINFD